MNYFKGRVKVVVVYRQEGDAPSNEVITKWLGNFIKERVLVHKTAVSTWWSGKIFFNAAA
jgi:hypothetical protein